FPTDLYMAEGLADLVTEQRCRLRKIELEELSGSLSEQTAVVMLTQVNFRDGELLDMAEITAAAHRVGALVLWDLAHSAGVVPLALDDWQVDLAVGCGYKFLNGGPGAPAFVYVAQRHQARARQPLSGWLGHAEPFAFETAYRRAAGIRQFQVGTPPIISMAALDSALDLFDRVSMEAVRKKSLHLTGCFIQGLVDDPRLRDFRVLTPLSDARRGSQVAVSHPDAWALSQALIERGVIVDYREPDIVRFGFAPLYNAFADVGTALTVLAELCSGDVLAEYRGRARSAVT
ncbi:MAG: aminotransferase class V-fold PLP-dependent enzyme, partial [Pseudomonadota bacterium]